jgi:mRNA-degrading endonuclease toxin of MazEF toxin-antitoxin module
MIGIERMAAGALALAASLVASKQAAAATPCGGDGESRRAAVVVRDQAGGKKRDTTVHVPLPNDGRDARVDSHAHGAHYQLRLRCEDERDGRVTLHLRLERQQRSGDERRRSEIAVSQRVALGKAVLFSEMKRSDGSTTRVSITVR